MAHTSIANERDFKRELFQKWIKEAVRLNETKGDSTKEKYSKKAQTEGICIATRAKFSITRFGNRSRL
jgi:hypothetical protein